ncbi:MAG: hypothetical protein H7Y00_05570 [Fimbriimonadaceae bacterium]|nr:hypothetical protein [Chitinophagales bacterium]
MKTLVVTAMLLISTFTFANKGGEQEFQLANKIKSIVQIDRIIEAMQLKGGANVWVTINEDKTLHVERVEAGDFLKSFYIKKTLEGAQVEVDDSMIGKTYAVAVEFVQSNELSSK